MVAVVVLGTWGAFGSYATSAELARRFPDTYGASKAEARFSELCKRLPASAKVGYITDLDPSESAYSSAFRYRDRIEAQFVYEGKHMPSIS